MIANYSDDVDDEGQRRSHGGYMPPTPTWLKNRRDRGESLAGGMECHVGQKITQSTDSQQAVICKFQSRHYSWQSRTDQGSALDGTNPRRRGKRI